MDSAVGQRGKAPTKVLADLVRTDRHNHRPVAGDSPEAAAIKVLARAHQNLIWDRTRHTNRLRNDLREFFSAALEAFDDLAHPDAVAVLAKAGILKKRKVTGNPALRELLEQAGARFTGVQVQQDGKLVTAYDDAAGLRFGKALVEIVRI